MLEFYDRYPDADPRIVREIPQGENHDVFSPMGTYMFTANGSRVDLDKWLANCVPPFTGIIKKLESEV
jgi:hypothetical protein